MGVIYIIEDDLSFAIGLEDMIKQYMIDSGNTYFEKIVKINNNFEQILSSEHIKKKVKDLYILDIDLDYKMNGLKLAQHLRMKDPNSYVLFVTSHKELMGEVFLLNLKAISFIYKSDPSKEERLRSALDQIHHELFLVNEEVLQENHLQYKFKHKYYKIAISEIRYIETNSLRRRLDIHGASDVYPCQLKLKEIEEQLPDYFIKIHRSVVVNMNCVKRINTADGLYAVVLNDEVLQPISRAYVDRVVTMFMA